MAPRLIIPSASVWIKMEVDFTSDWNTITPSYTDVTGKLRLQDGVSWSRGRNPQWDNLDPGSFTCTFDARDGTYDPAVNPNVMGSRQFRCSLAYPTPAAPVVQFKGVADEWESDYSPYGKDQIVRMTGVDVLTSMWFTRVTSAGGFLKTDALSWYRLICQRAGIPLSWQSFTPGTFPLIAKMTATNTDILSMLQAVANSQVQFLYVSRDGIVTTVPATSGAVKRVYDDSPDSLTAYSDVKGGRGGAGSYTLVEVDGSPAFAAGDKRVPATSNVPPGSITNVKRFGSQTLPLTVAPIKGTGDAQATNWATRVPSPDRFWFRELTIKPLAHPTVLIPAVMGHELGDRITILRHPLQGGVLSSNQSIRTISHDIKGGDWTVTYGLSYT